VANGFLNTHVVADNMGQYNIPNVITVEENLMSGYENLTSAGIKKTYTAWEKLFYHLDNANYDDVLIIEDDVAFNKFNFGKFVDFLQNNKMDLGTTSIRHKSRNKSWWFWGHSIYGEYCSFNPLCFLSKRMVDAVLEFRRKHKVFNFHEVLFPSLCLDNNFIPINFKRESQLKKMFDNFRYRPIITKQLSGFCHPVKNDQLHFLISYF
jgi:hypothetical protein